MPNGCKLILFCRQKALRDKSSEGFAVRVDPDLPYFLAGASSACFSLYSRRARVS